MNRRFVMLAAIAATIGCGTLVGVEAQQGAPPPPGQRLGRRHERHPEMMKALKALERAKADLQAANRDFGGHREKAVDLVNQAIAEVNEGIKFDKK